MRTIDVVASGLCAALYAGLGYLTYLGIFTPVIGVVRFWPVVIIPAIFAVVFGELVGGVGAAIGIFISDMFVHGNALLSLTVGVPANFLGFYTIGLLYKYKFNLIKSIVFISLASTILAIIDFLLYTYNVITFDVMTIFIFVILLTYILFIIISVKYRMWISYCIASYVGLLVGSAIIGIGVWGFSQLFILPTGEANLQVIAAFIWFIWTFSTEIPFLIVLGPPLLTIIHNVIPNLKIK